MKFTYPARITPNELGGHSVQFLDFPAGCTDGDNLEDAKNMASEVLYLLIEDYFEMNEPLPDPTMNWRGSDTFPISAEFEVTTN